MEKIGLIAGNRRFPLIFAGSARAKGYSIVAVGVKGDTSFRLGALVDKIYWLSLGDFGRIFKVFKDEGIKKVAMAGQISPARLFSRQVSRSPELKSLLDGLKDKKADTIFGAIADRLRESGLELLDSTIFVKEFMPQKGVLSVKDPDPSVREDINFGFEMAKGIGSLDIGQTVAVKSKAIVAAEALEGTDNLIRRAGKISRGGFTIVKVAKPKQDMRFDIPVVGLNTVKNIIRAKGACLAIEAEKTLFIDKEQSVRLADRKGIVIVAV